MAVDIHFVLIINIVLFLIMIVLTLIYILPVIFERRFHTVTNILTGNVCLAAILCSAFWVMYNTILAFYPMVFIDSTLFCSLLPYCETMFNCLVIYALAMITVNRFFTVIYPHKQFFKQQKWPFISLVIQWMIAIILPLPNILFSIQSCLNYSLSPVWLHFYNLFIIVILPSIINGFFNTCIFYSVHSSTRRIQALAAKASSSSAVPSNHHNTRDIYLLKHMLFIFIVFVGGWTPVYILPMVVKDSKTIYVVYVFLQLLPECSSLIVILDMFWYNHDLRKYLKERLRQYLHFN